MPKYSVLGTYTAQEGGRVWAIVEADSPEDALLKANAGNVEDVEYKSDGDGEIESEVYTDVEEI